MDQSGFLLQVLPKPLPIQMELADHRKKDSCRRRLPQTLFIGVTNYHCPFFIQIYWKLIIFISSSPYLCALQASRAMIAFLRFCFDLAAILAAKFIGRSNSSFLAI